MNRYMFFLALTPFFVACGGGGGSSASNESTDDSVSETPVVVDDLDVIALSGIYDTSRPDDESYLYIAKNGEVIAYDYQGDISGTGDNCYSIAVNSNQTNINLTGGVVTYSSTSSRYTIMTDTLTLTFTYNETVGIANFQTDRGFAGGSGMNIIIGTPQLNIKIGGSGGQTKSSLMISDIASAICS